MTCTFLGCEAPATRRTRGTWDVVWWYGCPAHIGPMIDAMYVGNSAKVQVEDL